VTSVIAKEVYLSPNGDRWSLGQSSTGGLTVTHQPNPASGGRASVSDVTTFLSRGDRGPEREALLRALEELGMHASTDDPFAPVELPPEVRDTVARALGQAVAQVWSKLTQDAQQQLFEAAVKFEGEAIRQQLAIFLHGRHARTQDAVHAQGCREPDSLGG
jgi:hypothetical protein